jgi:hypothetical protein
MPLKLIIEIGLLAGFAWLVSYAYDRLLAWRDARRELAERIAQLEALPPVSPDFDTPEGAILCLELALRRRDIEAAVASRDFATEARLWLQERGNLSRHITGDHLPEIIKAKEKSYRDTTAKRWPADGENKKSYFTKREPYCEGVVVVVSETVQKADGSLLDQRILVSQTDSGWRVVTQHLSNDN